jgi:hypothetical protein
MTFAQEWYVYIESLVDAAVDNTGASTGISRAFQHARPKVGVNVQSRIQKWKATHVRLPLVSGTTTRASTTQDNSDHDTVGIRVLLRNILAAVPELATVLEPLGRDCARSIVVTSARNSDNDAQHAHRRKCAEVAAALVDSWLTRLVGVLVTVYASYRADGARMLAMDPRKYRTGVGLLSASAPVVARNAIRFLLPALHCAEHIPRLGLVYLAGTALAGQVPLEEISRLTASIATPRHSGEESEAQDDLTYLLQQVVARADGNCSDCASCCWAAAGLIHAGADVHALDDYGRSALESATNGRCSHIFALLQGMLSYHSARNAFTRPTPTMSPTTMGTQTPPGRVTLTDMHERTTALTDKVDFLETRLIQALSAVADCLR